MYFENVVKRATKFREEELYKKLLEEF